MTLETLEPPQELLQKFGPLAYVTEKERTRIFGLPSGKFKPEVKALEKEIKERKKHAEKLAKLQGKIGGMRA